MKFALASDVHLEFGPLDIENTENADVLVLAGDIFVANDLQHRDEVNILGGREFKVKKSERIHDFFVKACKDFPEVVLILGNHEHYHGDFTKTFSKIKEYLEYLPNLHVLEKDFVKIGDTTFIGGTMWTDMNKSDPVTMYSLRDMMNDFNCVKNSNRMLSESRPARFTPEDAKNDHHVFMEEIRGILLDEDNSNVVMVTHHSPSRQTTHPRYKDDFIMNGGYSSDLDSFILDHPKIKAWCFGHQHNRVDFMIGPTRIINNSRGYINYEQCADTFKLKYIEV